MSAMFLSAERFGIAPQRSLLLGSIAELLQAHGDLRTADHDPSDGD